MKKYLYLLLVLLGACSYEDTPPEQALYCWKTQVQFSAEEADFVKNNRIERLYIRYCDVGLRDNAPVHVKIKSPVPAKPIMVFCCAPIATAKRVISAKPRVTKAARAFRP